MRQPPLNTISKMSHNTVSSPVRSSQPVLGVWSGKSVRCLQMFKAFGLFLTALQTSRKGSQHLKPPEALVHNKSKLKNPLHSFWGGHLAQKSKLKHNNFAWVEFSAYILMKVISRAMWKQEDQMFKVTVCCTETLRSVYKEKSFLKIKTQGGSYGSCRTNHANK